MMDDRVWVGIKMHSGEFDNWTEGDNRDIGHYINKAIFVLERSFGVKVLLFDTNMPDKSRGNYSHAMQKIRVKNYANQLKILKTICHEAGHVIDARRNIGYEARIASDHYKPFENPDFVGERAAYFWGWVFLRMIEGDKVLPKGLWISAHKNIHHVGDSLRRRYGDAKSGDFYFEYLKRFKISGLDRLGHDDFVYALEKHSYDNRVLGLDAPFFLDEHMAVGGVR